MKLDHDLQRAFDRLFSHHVRQEEIDGAQLGSGQGAFEAQMEAKAKRGGHVGFVIRSGFGTYRRAGSDLGCGCTAHCGHGDQYPTPDRFPFRVNDRPQDQRPDAVEGALKALDGPTKTRLERLARVMLAEHLLPFGLPFKADGGERYAAPLRGVAKEPPRGAGTIAYLCGTPQRLWGVNAQAETERLGMRLRARAATPEERTLARQIKAEAADLAEAALRSFAAALRTVDRLPLAVARVGRAA